MLNSTHTLVGLALTRTGLGRLAPHAAWTAVIAANLPDIDILSQLFGTASYIAYHRGITHTFVGIFLLSLTMAAVMHVICGKFLRHLLIALIAMTTHPLLDFANTYGVRPLFPFREQWYYGDIMFVIDPYVDLILLAAILASSHIPRRRSLLISIGFMLVIGYVVARVELRNIARQHLAVFAATVPEYQRSAVSPSMLDPFRWTGTVETADTVFNMDIDVFDGVGGEGIRMAKAAPSPAISAGTRTRTATVFMEFARFPVVGLQTLPAGGYRVSFIDLRFYRPNSRTAFGAEVVLDSELNVMSERIGFNQPVL